MINKIATIVPMAHLKETINDQYFMALSYAVEAPEYAKFFKARALEGAYVILDNSSVEVGDPGDFNDYLDKAIAISATEVMLPDIFRNAGATYDASRRALTLLANRTLYNPNVMIIPQGVSVTVWMQNAKELIDLVLPYTEAIGAKLTVGVSARYTDLFGGTRSVVFAYNLRGLPVHFLGCYANPAEEIRPFIDYRRLRSVDSSFPCVYTKVSMKTTIPNLAMPRPMTRLNLTDDYYDPELLRHNIDVWKEACIGNWDGLVETDI